MIITIYIIITITIIIIILVIIIIHDNTTNNNKHNISCFFGIEIIEHPKFGLWVDSQV